MRRTLTGGRANKLFHGTLGIDHGKTHACSVNTICFLQRIQATLLLPPAQW